MSLLLAIYTPTPEFTVQLDESLRGPDQKFSELVQQMEDHSLSWTKQFWVAWRALTAQPPILESRIHTILTTFEKEGFSKAPGRFQIEIMNCLSAAAEILDIPQDIKQFIQKHFS